MKELPWYVNAVFTTLQNVSKFLTDTHIIIRLPILIVFDLKVSKFHFMYQFGKIHKYVSRRHFHKIHCPESHSFVQWNIIIPSQMNIERKRRYSNGLKAPNLGLLSTILIYAFHAGLNIWLVSQ
jgi:hypothetical protein